MSESPPEPIGLTAAPTSDTAGLHRAAGCAPMIPLLIILTALGAVILIPNLYSDPNGLDPYVLRASAVAVAIFALTMVVPRLAPARLVAVSLVVITLGWSAFTAAPTLLYDFGQFGLRAMSGDQGNLYASEAWFGVTAVILLIVAVVAGAERPRLRLAHFGWSALWVSLAGIALLFLVVLLIPAPLLGREGLPVVAILRDAPWLVPANMLQGLAQELQFRGLLLGSLEKLTTPFQANLAQAVVFGLAHLAIVYQGPIAPFVPITAALGFLLGLATQRTRSIWPAVIVHMVADVVATLGVLPGLYGY